jgi:hypothetical protein
MLLQVFAERRYLFWLEVDLDWIKLQVSFDHQDRLLSVRSSAYSTQTVRAFRSVIMGYFFIALERLAA